MLVRKENDSGNYTIDPRIRSPLFYRLSCKASWEQAVGSKGFMSLQIDKNETVLVLLHRSGY